MTTFTKTLHKVYTTPCHPRILRHFPLFRRNNHRIDFSRQTPRRTPRRRKHNLFCFHRSPDRKTFALIFIKAYNLDRLRLICNILHSIYKTTRSDIKFSSCFNYENNILNRTALYSKMLSSVFRLLWRYGGAWVRISCHILCGVVK